MFKIFTPNEFVDSVFEIQYEKLREFGIEVIIFDLNNTLFPYHDATPNPNLLNLIDSIKEMGFKVMIVSNNTEKRVTGIAKALHLEAIYEAKKPFMDSSRLPGFINPKTTVMIGDEFIRDIYFSYRMGFYSIKVTPIDLTTEPFKTRVFRFLEILFVHKKKSQ